MQNFRSAVYALAGLAFVGLAAAFAVSLTLVVGALLTVTLGARMLMGKTKRAPVYVKAKRRDDVRVWNDGRARSSICNPAPGRSFISSEIRVRCLSCAKDDDRASSRFSFNLFRFCSMGGSSNAH